MSTPPPGSPRRRRLLIRGLPLVLIAALAFAAGALISGRSAEPDAVERFLAAWSRADYPAMHAELTTDAAADYPPPKFEDLYRDAATIATLAAVDPGDVGDPESAADGDAVPASVTAETDAFGSLASQMTLPVRDGAIAWQPHLVFPGLEPGEELERRTRAPDRASILARDGTPLAEGPAAARSSPLTAAADVVGTVGPPKREQAEALEALGFPPGTLAGQSGLELAFDRRLAGRAGGELLAAGGGGEPRILASTEPRESRPVRTTIDPDLQEAAVAALGSLFGGVAVLDARNGDVLAVAGVAFSAPQPPGSTFKVVTTVAALEEGAVALDEEFEVATSAVVGGREIANAHDEACGGTFVESFAHSCNSVFAPLGAEIGGPTLVDVAERFGFNSPPELYQDTALRAVDPPASTIPRDIDSDLDAGVSAIGQGEVLATPLQLASISQVIADDGVREPTSLVRDPGLRPDAEPVEVTEPGIAATVTDLMIEVVESGTGTAATIPGVQVAGKTGTAELGPDPDAPAGSEEQEVDAWFTAFAPADKPQLAVAAMVVDADGDGGTVAAPIVQEVLAAGLG